MHFSSLHSWFHCRGCYYLKCSSSLSQSLCKGQIKGKKTFFGQNSFQLMYNYKPKSNAPLRKNHKTADRKGGLFFDDFPKQSVKDFLNLSTEVLF